MEAGHSSPNRNAVDELLVLVLLYSVQTFSLLFLSRMQRALSVLPVRRVARGPLWEVFQSAASLKHRCRSVAAQLPSMTRDLQSRIETANGFIHFKGAQPTGSGSRAKSCPASLALGSAS